MTDRPIRVLLVEDSAPDAELIARALRAGGYDPDVAHTDNEAGLRRLLARCEFDLAITDHELPGFDGIRVLEIIGESLNGPPCLLVSGKVGEEAVSTVMRAGAVDYVAKDSLERLSAAAGRALAESERQRDREAANEALERSGRLFEAVFVKAHDAMLIIDDDRRIIDANPAAAQLLAMPKGRLAKLGVEDLIRNGAHAGGARALAGSLTGAEQGEIELTRGNGAIVPVEYRASVNFVAGRHILVLRDIRARRAAEADSRRHVARREALSAFGQQALRAENLDFLREETVRTVLETLGADAATVMELRAGERSFVVQAEIGPWPDRTGARLPHGSKTSSQASYTVRHGGTVTVAESMAETRFDGEPAAGQNAMHSTISVEIPGEVDPYGILSVGSASPGAFREEDGSFLTTVAVILADAMKRAKNQEEMKELALHDSLTGLANRTLFFDHLHLALARTSRLSTRVAVLFMDIDHFKAFNDTLGHRSTDRILTQVGSRLETTMRETDTVARFGGDEFVVLCEDVPGDEEAEILAARLASAFDLPFTVDEGSHELSVSIGIALSEPGNLDAESLLRDADTAMYRSKESGRGVWTVATDEMRKDITERIETKRALTKAIESDELVLHYQPIVDLCSGGLCAVEALVRWEDPTRGLVAPDQFIPLAEESGLILDLGEWVLRASCAQAAEWRAELGARAPLPVHINLSARQACQADLPQVVGSVLEQTGVPASDIVLEITETALIEGTLEPMAVLGELKSMGVDIVLDDFGTGYSSLSYLDRFPIEKLKIDRAFISQLEGPDDLAPIITAIVGMARALGVGTVAEGVETAEQSAAVAAIGCRYAQGYFFAKPTPAAGISRLVADDAPLRRCAAQVRGLMKAVGGTGAPRAEAGSLVVAAGSRSHLSRQRSAFLSALLGAEARAAENVIRAVLSEGIELQVIDAQIIGPAMVEVGRLWELGEVSVTDEHVATGIANRAAGVAAAGGAARERPDRHSRSTVLLAPVDGEEHSLGLRMVADVLESLAFEVLYLGTRVPAAELCAAAGQAGPEVIGLSITMPELGDRLVEQVAGLRAACPGARILIGGQGATEQLAERAGATHVVGLEELFEMASGEPSPDPFVPAGR